MARGSVFSRTEPPSVGRASARRNRAATADVRLKPDPQGSGLWIGFQLDRTSCCESGCSRTEPPSVGRASARRNRAATVDVRLKPDPQGSGLWIGFQLDRTFCCGSGCSRTEPPSVGRASARQGRATTADVRLKPDPQGNGLWIGFQLDRTSCCESGCSRTEPPSVGRASARQSLLLWVGLQPDRAGSPWSDVRLKPGTHKGVALWAFSLACARLQVCGRCARTGSESGWLRSRRSDAPSRSSRRRRAPGPGRGPAPPPRRCAAGRRARCGGYVAGGRDPVAAGRARPSRP